MLLTMDVSIDASLLRNAIRLVHCLQKERGSSCAFYANNESFQGAMMEARSASDISTTLIRRNDVPVASTLSKIRNLIASHPNAKESDDNLALHRIFVCFNTLISYVVHEYILKQIPTDTNDDETMMPTNKKSTIKNRHRRGLSTDINDRLASTTTLTPETENHKTFVSPSRSKAKTKLATLHSMDENEDSSSERGGGSGSPPAPPPPATSSSRLQQDALSWFRRVSFAEEKPKIQQILDLLHLFVQLKESAGVERAILSSLLAFRGTDDPSLPFLMSDLILEVENQRSLISQLESLPEDSHRNFVLELASLSPQLQDLQLIILSDFESLTHAEYDSENIWDLITLYIDKLHSVELLLVEELECSLPVTMSKVLSSGALNTLVSSSPTTSSGFLQLSSSPKRTSQAPPTIPEEKVLIGLALQQVFATTNGTNLLSSVASMTPEEVKRRLLEVLHMDESEGRNSSHKEAEENGEKCQHVSAAANLKEDMERALDVSAKQSYRNNNTVTSSAGKEWEISIYELKFSKRIGVGAAATTYLADWTGQEVAVKVASTSRFGLEGWRTEVDALQRLHHPNIIRLLGSVYHETPLTYCLVLEYCNAGDLSTVLKYATPKNFFFTAALGIANAMVYLHSRNIIHRDLKPANVLCDGNVANGHFTVKVTDFGVATEMKDDSTSILKEGSLSDKETRNMTGETGTYRWMAPEVIRHENYSTKADVYSFAVMLWQFLTREDPFYDIGAIDAAHCVAIEKERPPMPSNTPSKLADILHINWTDDQNTRWPFEKVSTELRNLQNTLTAEEKAFLESTHGHPVYEYDEPEIEEAKGTKPPPKAPGNRRGSMLSSFFGQKRPYRKKKGQN